MLRNKKIRSMLLSAALICPVIITGCAARVGVGYRTYDPYYHGYRTWDHDDQVYYNQWVIETHHPHREYRHLNHEDQRRYWQWRHDHDRDHHHDRDHDRH